MNQMISYKSFKKRIDSDEMKGLLRLSRPPTQIGQTLQHWGEKR